MARYHDVWVFGVSCLYSSGPLTAGSSPLTAESSPAFPPGACVTLVCMHNVFGIPHRVRCNSPSAVMRTLQIVSKRMSHLASLGLLQQQQPEESQLLVTAANALPDELLTIVQVGK